MSDTPDTDRIEPILPDARVCTRCGHALEGMPDEGTCPECGSHYKVVEPPPESLVTVLKKLGPASILGAAAVLLPPLGGFYILYRSPAIADWLTANQTSGVLVYVCAFAVLSGLALLPTYAQAFIGGYAFKLTLGVPAALAGFTGGSIIGYEVALRVSGDRATKLISEHPRWNAIYRAFVNTDHPLKTLGLVMLVRLPPNSPFALTNLVLAAVKIPRWIYVVGTAVGMAPRTIVAVYLGSQIETLTSKQDISDAAPAWLWWVGLGVTIAVVFIIGHMANKVLRRIVAAHEPTTEGES